MARKHIRERTLRAATIVAWLELDHDTAKEMTEAEILGLIEYDHFIPHAQGGPDTHWNLFPLFRQDHKIKTTKDLANMAKERKVKRANEQHKQTMQAKTEVITDLVTVTLNEDGYIVKRRSRWPSRKFPKRRQKWTSP